MIPLGGAAWVALAALAWGATLARADITITPEARGTAVVASTLSRIEGTCVMPDDFQFLRRVALAETNDGAAPNTFRPGYYGGIWQVL